MNLPNKITIFRICCIPIVCCASLISFKYHWAVACIFYAIACISDYVDGKIARSRGIETDFGRLMDPISDKCLVLGAFLIFSELCIGGKVVIMVTLLREFLVSGLRMLALREGKVIEANFWGKLKTFLQMLCTNLTFLFLSAFEIKKEVVVMGKYFNAPYELIMFTTFSFWIITIITLISGLKYVKDGWYLIKTK